MTPEKFFDELGKLHQQLGDINNKLGNIEELREQSLDAHAATQKRLDYFADHMRAGLRADIGLMLKPVVDTVETHTTKLKDHETRLRSVETESIKRQVMVGGGAGLAMAAIVSAIQMAFKSHSGG